jgi:hypothetical protein
MKNIEQQVKEIEERKRLQKIAGINIQETSQNDPEKLYSDLLGGMEKFMEFFKNNKGK